MNRTNITCLIALVFTSHVARAQVAFSEEALARGVAVLTYYSSTFGRGLGLEDLDGDGDLDLVLTGRFDEILGLYENDGAGFFSDRSVASGVPLSENYAGVALGDADGDGDFDLYLSAVGAANVLARNDGNFQFTDVTAAAGLGDTGHTMGCSWGDYDGDGWLDLYVANRGPFLNEPSRLFRNLGDGSFADVGGLLGVEIMTLCYQARFFDYDLDGDADLYVTNDKGDVTATSNRLWRNDGGTFTDVGGVSGAGVSIDGMGVGLGDANRDGSLDIYLTNTQSDGGDLLLVQQVGGVFVDQATSYGLGTPVSGWGVVFFDCDNDGFEDLYVTDGGGPARLYRGGSSPPLAEASVEFGLASVNETYCATPGDLDGDGDLDLVVQAANALVRLYINHEGELQHWLKIRLVASGANVHAVGATVTVRVGSDEQIRQVYGSGSFKDAIPSTLHFGLGGATAVDEVRVLWPGGEMSSVLGVAADQLLIIDDSGAMLPVTLFVRGDANADGAFNIADPITELSYLFGSAVVECAAALDANADGALNLADPITLLSSIFSGGPPPPAPHPGCGAGTVEDLACVSFAPCE
ncbi:MAG: FG-GAP-like repeat-containing protein [Planctomycetota bacterium]